MNFTCALRLAGETESEEGEAKSSSVQNAIPTGPPP